ncbi:MAG: hypothetical protein WCK89_05200 [bacterium]
MRNHQVAWRNVPENDVSREHGSQNGLTRPWILLSDKWEQSLWPGIRTGSANPLPDYLKKNSIQPHQGKHNLNSSWVQCANLYFPFGTTAEGRELLAGFLRAHVSPDVQTVDELHLEYEEDRDVLKPAELLGEPGGMRGSGQTSPDLAFHINGHTGLILIENKFTEHSFYRCSARTTEDSEARPANPAPSRCLNVSCLLADPQHQCHQCTWGRKYWNLLRPVANEAALSRLKRCPAATAGYQLFRQQALAQGIANSKYDQVFTCVALDARNATLLKCLRTTGLPDLESGWSSLFDNGSKVRFKVFTHQAWVTHVAKHGPPSVWRPWLNYVTTRYGY